MNIYLVNIDYNVSQYMGDEERKSKTHLVHADSEEEARNKVIKYYEDKTSEYCTYYTVYNVEVCETIM